AGPEQVVLPARQRPRCSGSDLGSAGQFPHLPPLSGCPWFRAAGGATSDRTARSHPQV
ncbi:uncharacterized protein METZ01_LOCUS459473, partial [marine metagenome]